MNDDGLSTAIRVERPAKTLRELALDKVREAIVNGYFRPGDRLVERDLCAQLGVSRTIVREVLRHLESEGLVANLPNKGPIVAQLNHDEAKQIYEIRAALEGMAARLCAEQNNPAIADALDKSLEDIRQSYRGKDMAGVLAHTSSFYQTLFSSVDRHVAWGVVNLLTVRINHLRSMTIKTRDRDVQGPAQMARIVDAIRRGDGEGAYRAAMEHVASASAIAQAVLSDRQPAD
ncbi:MULTISPECIES: GntR family transcriptional regulator [Rhizobium]|uniref:GntR family transcriptional regulator n=1 Tax=Rhizobium tropici TaxID=398 RepID=A0A329YM85_RHITR|nr:MULTISPECIES: GntR family transcriptional regulator [Rhizobium]MBB3291073.1 DNA-binding GntR family transcriptional regulator [Rhizobium sp. BK252]MBB3405852.1 DNA-binding GntR family transcriptional regulator [Rhizobium sp. BK289]MBB3418400.1 DNA-binding GntR family transcriptional regulator [Rhizobium sp. BK284]MBB3486278.1 DNA-binding GntR family transcriptional regulator [Rhizobium sp. BK347]MDK4724093.1 GntR family transcriptional regulator [Rhizobium sp. CNPSo 3968]